MKKQFVFFTFQLVCLLAAAQQRSPLYPHAIPGAKATTDREISEVIDGKLIVSGITRPELIVFLPAKEKHNGAAIIIFPGGGYWVNALSHEGTDVAKECARWGLTAFVVKYRIPDSLSMEDPSAGPLQDARQAMLRVYQDARKYNIDTTRIGIMGFSAGGHLAATFATKGNGVSSAMRPAFAALIYPVISADSAITHAGSFHKLLGSGATADRRNAFSAEKNVNNLTPPAFLVHAADDDVVPVQNSLRFYEAMLANKRPVELHLYQSGGHGFGMHNPRASDKWMERFQHWLKDNRLLERKPN